MLKTKIKHLIRDLDFFEYTISFCIKENIQGFQSVFGGMISLLILILLLFLFIKNFIQFDNDQYPEVQIIEQFTYDPSEIKMQDGSFMIAIGFDDSTFSETNEQEQYIQFSLSYMTRERFTNGSTNKIIQQIPLTLCTTDHYSQFTSGEDGSFDEKFYKYGMEQFYCPMKENFSNLTIVGEFWSDMFQYLQIEYLVNENKSEEALAFVKENCIFITGY